MKFERLVPIFLKSISFTFLPETGTKSCMFRMSIRKTDCCIQVHFPLPLGYCETSLLNRSCTVLVSTPNVNCRREIVSDPAFRTLVYELRLHRSPLVRSAQAATRRTGISPQYFRDNEGTERTRISEFVRRELIALIPVGIFFIFSRTLEEGGTLFHAATRCLREQSFSKFRRVRSARGSCEGDS